MSQYFDTRTKKLYISPDEKRIKALDKRQHVVAVKDDCKVSESKARQQCVLHLSTFKGSPLRYFSTKFHTIELGAFDLEHESNQDLVPITEIC